MANYTMTIAEMLSNPMTSHIFPDNYEFYMDDEEARKSFEDKFIQYYYYREIGFETPFMFIQKLETHLIVNMPYWKQLYETELEAKDINFLLNKDLKETFIREIESNNEMSGTDTTHQNSTSTTSVSQNGNSTSTNSMTQDGTSTSTSSVSQNGTSSTNHKESSLSDGVSSAMLTDGYLTGISADTSTSSSEGTTNVSDTNKTTGESSSEESNESTGESSSVGSNETTGTSTKTENGTTAEKTELLSQGNIGITSSAQLLKEWRDVLINMDKIIIDSCNDLFLKIY